ncbi:MAG: PAC2 family protein [Halobacteriales archaeon]|nr:PAC2 family protein [Halobacteriales archaeon]
MAGIRTVQEVDLDSPFLVEGLPGVGLVGQIIVDHLDDELGMSYHASVDCDSLPQVAIFDEGVHGVQPPVRLHADEKNNLVVLRSDVPVSPRAEGFADCLMGWMVENDVTPIFVSGLPQQPEDVPSLFGVSTGDGEGLLEGIEPPENGGVVSGPTGALLKEADDREMDSVCLIVESDPQFPDPAAARVVIRDGIEPITGVKVETSELVEKSEEIMEKKEQLAKKLQADEEESTTATTTGMYH